MILFINAMFLLFFKTPVYGATTDSLNIMAEKTDEISAEEGGVTAVLEKTKAFAYTLANNLAEYINTHPDGLPAIVCFGAILWWVAELLCALFFIRLDKIKARRMTKKE